MDDDFQKSIVPIDEEELKPWEQPPATTSNSGYTNYITNHSDYLVYTDKDGKQHYFSKADAISPF